MPKPLDGTRTRDLAQVILSSIATLIVAASVCCWFLIHAYANWLRFSSPTSPNPSTGQTIFMKASKGVFYITPEQAWWAQTISLPVWGAGFLAALLAYAMRPREQEDSPGETQETLLSATLEATWTTLIALISTAGMIVLFFGDEVMQYYFTGSFEVPNNR